jgi:hypothetical protein
MEIIIALVVLGFGLWWFFLRTPADTFTPAPYKVETPPTPEPESVVTKTGIYQAPEPAATTPIPLVVETAPVVEVAPVKKPRKPRAPKVVAEQSAAKKAAPVKKAAAIKAAPKKPRSKKV